MTWLFFGRMPLLHEQRFFSRFLALNVLFLPKKQNSFLGHWWSVIVRLMLNCSIQFISGHWTICRRGSENASDVTKWQNDNNRNEDSSAIKVFCASILVTMTTHTHTHKLSFYLVLHIVFFSTISSWWKLFGTSSTSIRLEIQNKHSCYWSV